MENRSTTANEEVKDAKEKSRTDKLTGLLNRHGMDEDTERVIALNKRRGSKAKMSIVNLDMIDLNVFNNTLGHEAGDHALVQLADAINARKRVTDIAGRTGGDEFEVILPDTDEQQALVLSEGLKEELNQRNVNASIGVAEIDYSTPEMLRESKHLADLAMYKAKASFKQTGVNEIVASTSLTEEDIMKTDELKKLAEARTAKRLEPVSLENVA